MDEDQAPQPKPEAIVGTAEHARAMRDWETEQRRQPVFEHDRRMEIARTQSDILVGPKGDVDADVGYQGPQSK